MPANSDPTAAPDPKYPPPMTFVPGEMRAFVDLMSVPLSLARSALGPNEGQDAPPIILLPGFGSDQRALRPLERYLKNLGYQTEDWGLGLNLAGLNLKHSRTQISDVWDTESLRRHRGETGVPFLFEQVFERVRNRTIALKSPVVLIGWSLGGLIAREIARELPEQVSHIITLGSPAVGGPRYSSLMPFFRAGGFDVAWVERELERRSRVPIQQPMTIVYSKTDAIVDWRASIDKLSPNAEHVQVEVSHLGMGFNRTVFQIIRGALKKHRAAGTKTDNFR